MLFKGEMDLWALLIFGTFAVALAGAIKGFVGLGFPTAAMGLLTLSLPPRVAIALILLPMLVSNIWQFLRAGEVRATIAQHWRFGVILTVGVALVSFYSRDVDDRLLLGLLGVAIFLFVGLSWVDAVPEIPPSRLRLAEGASAVASAIIGGLTAGWAAPLSAYLLALRLAPIDFIRATGFLISMGSVPLVVSYLKVGHMTPQLAGFSALMIAPTLAGFSVGEAIRKKASPAQFKRVLLWVFLALGLNLMYRAFFGA